MSNEMENETINDLLSPTEIIKTAMLRDTSTENTDDDPQPASEDTAEEGVPASAGGGEDDVEKIKKELSDTKKRLDEARKWGTKNSRKIDLAINKIAALVESGNITEEEAEELRSDIKSDNVSASAVADENAGISRFISLAIDDLRNIERYTDEEDAEEFKNSISSFDAFCRNASREEIEKISEELEILENSPPKLAKKIIQIGKRYYDDVYKDAIQSGGMGNVIKKQKKEIEELTKKIDKLTKRVSSYSEFDEPTYRINESGSFRDEDDSDGSIQDSPTALIARQIGTASNRRR